jgi:hypothetical protein
MTRLEEEAKRLGVSYRSALDARVVRKLDPSLADKVFRGEITLRAATWRLLSRCWLRWVKDVQNEDIQSSVSATQLAPVAEGVFETKKGRPRPKATLQIYEWIRNVSQKPN